MDKLYVKPVKPKDAAEPLKTRMPENGHQHVPVGGTWVPNTRYYRNRIKEGSLVIATPPKAPQKKQKPKEK